MRFKRLALAASIVVVLTTACNVIPGSGRAVTESRDVTGFTTIDLSAVGDVTVETGAEDSLTVEADDNVLPNLTSEVQNGTLTLGNKPGLRLRSQTPIRYRVTVTRLDGLILSGSGTMTAENLTADALTTDISGSGVVVVGGAAKTQTIKVSGSGRHDASRLTTERVNATVSGSGEVLVDVSGELTVDISGSGTVTYSGSPKVTESISGSGRVVKK